MGFWHSRRIFLHAATQQKEFEDAVLVFFAQSGGLGDVQTMDPNAAVLGCHLVATVRFG